MYTIKSSYHFDSAHFLSNYSGKCKNIHGHRWTVEVEYTSLELNQSKQNSGMICDFSELKRELKNLCDYYDHSLILEKGSLQEETINCLLDESFKVVMVDFRTTAENFSKHFYYHFKNKNYPVKSVTVFETQSNSAKYEE
jgi:6-pyruvoyltetrahydropterin/6-carboxytetrahydropterin synthase